MPNTVVFQKPNWIEAELYVCLSKSHLLKLTNHRKIPCSKYSGRYIILFEDAFCFPEVMPTEEEIEPP